jgi:hypothetical protein
LLVDHGSQNAVRHSFVAQSNDLRCSQVKAAVAALDERNDDVVANLRARELKYVLGTVG